MPETRVYFYIHAQTAVVPTELNWRNLIQDMISQPNTLAAAILQAARAAQNYISASKRSQNPAELRRYTLCGVEIENGDPFNLLSLLDSKAASRGIAGNRQTKFEGVIQAEAREAAVRIGFSAAQAALISVAIVGIGAQMVAIHAAQAYLAANAPIWRTTD